MNDSQLPALKAELINDPKGVGYAAVIDDHVAVAKLVTGQTGTIDNPDKVPSLLLFDSLDPVERDAIFADAIKSRLLLLLLEMRDLGWDESKGLVKYLFPVTTKSFIAWRKAVRRKGSRAEELGFGSVNESEVSNALLRTP